MSWYNSVEILGRLIPSAQVLIVALTVFTIWASVQRGRLEKQEKSKLTTEVANLQQRTWPRTITLEQENKLIEMLSFSADCQVATACRVWDQEACDFAEMLAGVFQKADWTVLTTNRSYLDDTDGDVAVVMTSDTQREVAQTVMRALNEVGIIASGQKVREGSIADVKGNTVYIIVGSKKR